jgi:hypothetical protein
MNPNELNWSDGIGHRSRASWLLFVDAKRDRVIRFVSSSIDGVVAVVGTSFTRNGKWSHTTYRLLVADGIRAITGLDGWETGRFVEGLQRAVGASAPIDRWPAVAEALGVSVPAAMEFLRAWRPKAAEALDEVDVKLELFEAQTDADAAAVSEVETVVVSFGSPTRRQREEGFWHAPKAIPGTDEGEVALIASDGGWVAGNVAVHGVSGVVTDVRQSGGYGGGYVAVTVAIRK